MTDLVVDRPAPLAQLPQGPSATPAQAYIASLPSPHSRDAMIWGLRAFAKELNLNPDEWATIPWHELDAALIGLAQTKLTERMAPSSVNTARAALRGTLRSAWRLGLLSEDTLRRLDDVKPARGSRLGRGRRLTFKEQEVLLKTALEASPGLLGLRNMVMLAVGLGCGLRRGELVKLTIESFNPADFDGKGSLLFVGKGNKGAKLPLPPGVLLALQRWVNARGGQPGPLFPACDRRGVGWGPQRLTPRYFAKMLATTAEKAGIGAVAPHDLRRTYGTGLFAHGHDIGQVKRLMRHAKPETTLKYDLRGETELAATASTVGVPIP